MRKCIVLILILGFFVNIFSTFPFEKVFAENGLYLKNKEEVILNEDYYDENQTHIYELENKRDTYTKSFMKNDGSIDIYQYDTPIHYLDDDGIYQEIDSSFIESGNELSSFSLDYNVKLPKKLHENKKIKLSYQNTKLEITYNGITKSSAELITNTTTDITDLNHLIGNVKYKNIYDSVDLELISNSISLKENIILNKYIKDFSFSYDITLTNLTLIQKDNYLYLLDENNKVIYTIDPYYMISDLGYLSYDINVSIQNIKKDKYRITVIPNDDWLKDATYPVIIDPTIHYPDTESSLGTSYLKIRRVQLGTSGSTEVNNFDLTKYYDEGFNEDNSVTALMQLDIRNIPKDVEYNNATLTLVATSSTSYFASIYKIDMYQVTSTINFDNYNPQSGFNSKFLSSQTIKPYNRLEFNFTDALFTNKSDEYLYFKLNLDMNCPNETTISFYGTTSSYKPVIKFNYFDAAGLKDYWTYHNVNLSENENLYINDFSGNLVLERADYINPTERMSFSIVHYYNSVHATKNIGYGNGWTINYHKKIVPVTGINGLNEGEYYYLEDGTGHKKYYKYDSTTNQTKLYLSEEGDDSKLYINETTSEYKIIDDDKYVYKFNNNMHLSRIYEKDYENSQYITVSFTTVNNQLVLSNITDAVGNKAIFTYNDNNLLDTITIMRINDQGLNIVKTLKYSYGSNNLNYIYESNNGNTSLKMMSVFTYTGYYLENPNLLIDAYSILSPNDSNYIRGITVSYDSRNKVSEYQEYYKLDNESSNYELPKVLISYDTYVTHFTDVFYNTVSYTFDKFGHTINIYDSEGNSKFYKYNMNDSVTLNHKLLTESSMINNTYNIISNNGFENYGNNMIQSWNVENADATGNQVNLSYENRVFGLSSLKIKNGNSSLQPSASQTLYLSGGNSYRFSMFIKQENEGVAANIKFIIKDLNGNIVDTQEKQIEGTTQFEKYDVSVYLLSQEAQTFEVEIILSTAYNTTSYFDNILMNTDINNTYYNLLEDASFENTNGITSSIPWNGGMTVEAMDTGFKGSWSRHLLGQTDMSQTVNYEVIEGTTISFGGYVFANTSLVEISVQFYNTEQQEYSSVYTIKYREDVNDYQYLLESITNEEGTWDQIIFVVRNKGYSDSLVDNLILTANLYINNYSYQEDGKLSKIQNSYTPDINISYDDSKDLVSIENGQVTQTISTEYINNLKYRNLTIEGTLNTISVSNTINSIGLAIATIVGTTDGSHYVTSQTYTEDCQYLTSYTNEFNNTTNYNYDTLTGLLQSITNAKNVTTSYEYNDLKYLEKIITSNNVIEYTYNQQGLIDTITGKGTSEDSIQHTYKFEYNIYGDLIKVSHLNGTYSKTIVEYEYLLLRNQYYTGLLQRIIYPNGYKISYQYNEKAEMIGTRETIDTYSSEYEMTLPVDILSLQYTYNQLNQISVCYDYLNNIIYFYDYDIKGNLIRYSDNQNNYVNYTYNELNQLVQIDYSINGITDSINYNQYEDGTLITTLSNNVELINDIMQDDLNRLFNKVLIDYNSQKEYIYMHSFEYENSTNSISESSTNNLTSNRISKETYSAGNYNYTYEYSYDELGNISQIIETKIDIVSNVKTSKTYIYIYDNNNYLIEENIYTLSTPNISNYILSAKCVYNYDVLGNIINKTVEYYDDMEIVSYIMTYNNSTDYSKLNNYQFYYNKTNTTYSNSIQYDQNGNIINYNGYTITYQGTQVTKLSKNGIDYYKYTYDSFGNRIKKEIYNTTTNTYDIIEYVYVDGMLVAEKHSDKIIKYIYDASSIIGMKIINQTTNEETNYYYIKNITGDVIKIIDEDGIECVEYLYNGYGELIDIKGTLSSTIGQLNPIRYKGYYYNVETKLYYCNARYYNPEICRFISPDSIDYLNPETISGLNLYCYCMNNPINYIDPSGHWTISFSININLNFLIGISLSIAFSFDSNGDNAIQLSYSQPFDYETPNIGLFDVGISFTCQYTNLNSVDDLEGIASYIGGAIGSAIYISGDIITNSPIAENGGEFIGGQIGVGIGFGLDIHTSQIKTKNIKKNWEGLIEKLFGWLF